MRTSLTKIVRINYRFVPSSMIYLEKNGKSQDQIAMPSETKLRSESSTRRSDVDDNDITDRSQEARFGFTNLGSTGSVSHPRVHILVKSRCLQLQLITIEMNTGLRSVDVRSSENRLGRVVPGRYHRDRIHSHHT